MSASEKLRSRIRALLDKTAARGCTEAEALAAAEKAAQLMRDHGISMTDLAMDEQSSPSRIKGSAIKAQLWPVIGGCTNTASIVVTDAWGTTTVNFIGREPGPQIAVYLRTVCERALDHGVRQFKAGKFYRQRKNLRTKRQAVSEYQQGFVNRLGQRLLAIFGPQVDPAAIAAAGRALDERYGETDKIKPKAATLEFVQARADGWTAAGDVHLAHGLGAGEAPKQIGGAS